MTSSVETVGTFGTAIEEVRQEAEAHPTAIQDESGSIRLRTSKFSCSTGASLFEKSQRIGQQLTGINFIFYFGTTFFTNAGIHNPYLISIATSTVNVGPQ